MNITIPVQSMIKIAIPDNPAGISARNLLTAYRLMEYETFIPVPDTKLKSATTLVAQHKRPGKYFTGISIFPNPADDYVVIACQLDKEAELNIVSQDGRIVHTQLIKPGNNQVIVRVNQLPSGTYIAKMVIGKTAVSSKFSIK